ncbi:MAG TPA: B12-binding domain-containing radical SAM protein [Pyrinomonadaceae bacterium]|nr:B12-binding domain-containing radical SAM protein [Pyrinomonadaceae bacterium]
MKVLMVYPEFPNTYWSFKYALPLAGKSSSYPPLGLMTISGLLPGNWEKRLVDMNVEALTDNDLRWADVVFASAMIVQQPSLIEVIKRAKAFGLRVVLGGPLASAGAELVATPDHIFVGEAEAGLTDLLRDLESGRALPVYQANGKPDLAHVQPADLSLIDMRHYSSMAVQYSRGCPFSCEFCDIIEIYGRVPRTKTSDQMLVEFDSLYKMGWRGSIFIVDDNFIGNKKNVKEFLPDLCRWMKEHHHPFRLFTEASLNLADDEPLLDLMRNANFHRVLLGIETPVEESLKAAKKGQNTRRDLIASVRKIQSYGIEVMGAFIVGFDQDPADIFQRQIDFIRQSAIPIAMVGLLTALPETQLWRRLKKEGRLLEESTGDNTDCSLNFETRMNRQTVLEGYKTILKTLYHPREFYARAQASLKNTSSTGFSTAEIKSITMLLAGVRVLFKLGLLDASRKEFWRFLRRIYCERRDLLPDAMVLAAMGYHVRKLTEQYCGPLASS